MYEFNCLWCELTAGFYRTAIIGCYGAVQLSVEGCLNFHLLRHVDNTKNMEECENQFPKENRDKMREDIAELRGKQAK